MYFFNLYCKINKIWIIKIKLKKTISNFVLKFFNTMYNEKKNSISGACLDFKFMKRTKFTVETSKEFGSPKITEDWIWILTIRSKFHILSRTNLRTILDSAQTKDIHQFNFNFSVFVRQIYDFLVRRMSLRCADSIFTCDKKLFFA